MAYKRIISGLLVSLCLPWGLFSQNSKIKSLSLQEALELAEKNNYQIQIAITELEKNGRGKTGELEWIFTACFYFRKLHSIQ